MRLQLALAVVLTSVLAIVLLTGAQEPAAHESLIPGVKSLSGALAGGESYLNYLFSQAEREELDRLNRRIRELDKQYDESSDPAARSQIAADHNAAAGRLFAILQRYPGLIRIDTTGDVPVMTPNAPLKLAGDRGAMLLRIDGGEGPVGCFFDDYDLSVHEGTRHGIKIAARRRGVTWAVLELKNVPMLRSELILRLKDGDEELGRLMFRVDTPPKGRLRLAVNSSETGRPVPAMLQLRDVVTGELRRPSNAVDVAGQFDNLGRADGLRRANLPGKLRGKYWCVPGPFKMDLPPGKYDVIVRRGVEHVPVFDSISIESDQDVQRTYTPRRWVDMPKLGWYSGDDHVHCRIESDADAQRLMAWVQAEDIHVANVVKMGDVYRTWFEQRGFGPAYRVVEGTHVLSPGQECPRTHDQLGHTLAMNTTSMVRDTDKYFLYDLVFDAVHAQGGLSGYAHVNAGLFHVHRDMSINIPQGKIDFVEVMQFASLGTDLLYDFLNTGFKMTVAAGSDVPWGGTIGEQRLYAYTGDQPFSADAWFEAVRRGRTFVTNGPMLELSVDDAMPGDELVVAENRKLRVRAKAWGDPERTLPLRLEIIRHGEVLRTVEPQEPGQKELTLDFELEAGAGYWLAARAIGTDEAMAHTTPVYVIRKGLRFWKFDEAAELIDKRLESLASIEKIVADARRNQAGARRDADRFITQLAAQGDQLLERVTAAREIYRQLQQTLKAERAIRPAALK